CIGRMPFSVSSTKVFATVSIGGNSRCGKRPAQATASQIAPTTRNGKTLRATMRSRSAARLDAPPDAAETAVIAAASCIAEITSRYFLSHGSRRTPCGQDNALVRDDKLLYCLAFALSKLGCRCAEPARRAGLPRGLLCRNGIVVPPPPGIA